MHIQTRTKFRRILAAWSLALIVASVLLSLFVPAAGQAYASSSLQAVCRDTVVGYAATCSAAADPGEEVTFKIVKPDRSAVRFQAIADRKGIATGTLSRLHTTKVGTYHVGAYPSWIKEPQDLTLDSFSVIQDGGRGSNKSLVAASVTGVGGPISTFKITAPASVKAGEAFDVKVCAVDDTDQPVTGYDGTILFFVAGDENAVVPFSNEGYAFTGTDQDACHTFAKGVTLTTKGQVRLAVADVDNPEIAADAAITVTDKSVNANANGAPSTTEGVAITSPTNGSTYGETSVSIIGTGPKSSKITLTDGARELGSVQSSATGAFTYSASGLTDGKHDFVAEAFDANGGSLGKSPAVSITVNTQGATLQGLTILPSETVAPNTVLTVTVMSEPKLARARLVVADVAHDLRENVTAPGRYESTFAAPANPGTYDLKLTLTNSLNRETAPLVPQKLTVRTVDEKLVIAAQTAGKPGTATVSWQVPRANADIVQYHVFYGTNPVEPEFEVKVENKGTSAHVEGLKGDTTYYFTVAPIYKDGREGVLSETVSVRTPVTPPATLPLIGNTKAIGASRRINLTWDEPDLPAAQGVAVPDSDAFNMPSGAIAQYVIDYSTTSDKPESQVKTGSTTTTWSLPNLEECKEYFFQVTAVDAAGKPVARSAVFSGKTTCGDNACQAVQVAGLHAVYESDGSQTLSWQRVLGARAYRVYAGSVIGRADYGQWDVTDTRFPIFATRFPRNADIVFAVQALGEGDCFENAAVSNAIRTRVGPGLWIVAALSIMVGIFFAARSKHAPA